MTITESRKQLSPTIGRNPQQPTYRQGPAPYRGYHDGPDDFPPPPPPPSNYMDQNFPPPPPETRENIYHEIRDDFPPPPAGPPPPVTGASSGDDYRGPEPMFLRPGGYNQPNYTGSYDSRQDMMPPGSGPYERVVKQATYSVQSSDSSGRSSPYSSSQYANIATMQSSYSPTSTPQTYSQSYGQYSAKPRSSSPGQYSPSSPRSQEDSGVTYAQIVPRSERAVPGPQVPVQIKVTDSRSQLNMQPSPNQPRSLSQQPYAPSPQQYSSSRLPTVQQTTGKEKGSTKEQEVDDLTKMLMQGLEGTKDPDFFGICGKCGKKVVGEVNGCNAMEQVFHIACFVCVSCGSLLRGKSFYAMERKPFCEPCYMNTLEKCSICSKPITDRLLRATGKPYHPACFTCVVCGKSLDGIPFTVDATNQIHCIEDFHKKFAPRCCVCHQPIMPERGQEETVRVVAMDRSFHVQCYRCEDCGLLLSSEAEGRGCYPLDDHILCKNCNAKRINALTTKLATEL